MQTKLGFHVVSGSRSGYGPAAGSGPALVVSVGEAGAFDEVPAGTVKVYRDISVYPNTPPDLNTLSPEIAYKAATEYWGPRLMAVYEPIRARYPRVIFQPWNEPAANTDEEYSRNIAYEKGLIDYFTDQNINIMVGNLSGDDPVWEMWVKWYIPHLLYAAERGHAYGRHAYGGVPQGSINTLTANGEASGSNPARPFREASELWQSGIQIPVYITEAGQNGGYQFPGVEVFTADVAAYDALCLAAPNVGGFACWTYGNYQGRPANIEAASGWMASYLGEREIAQVSLPPVPEPPPPPAQKHKAIIVKLPQEAGVDTWYDATEYSFERRHTMTASHDDMLTMLRGGNDSSYVKMVHPWEPSQIEARQVAEEAGYTVVDIDLGDGAAPPPPSFPPFDFEYWPTRYKTVTQPFGANPSYYAQFGLPGHEGIDIQAPMGSPVYAVAGGIVYRIETADNSNYGLQVRIDHGNGYRTIYAHLDRVLVTLGQTVAGGRKIGLADSSGNSSGSHLHLTLKYDGATANGSTNYPNDIIDPTNYLKFTLPLAPPDAAPRRDLWPYFRADGTLWILTHNTGAGERCQLFNEGGRLYFTKNRQYEHIFLNGDGKFICRDEDTSPGAGRYYRLKDDDMTRGSRWAPRYMAVGETYERRPVVSFYTKDGCALQTSYREITYLQYVRHYDQWNNRTWSGSSTIPAITLNDCIELTYSGGETYIYTADQRFSLVGWRQSRITPDPNAPLWSVITEIIPRGSQADNVREVIGCL